MASCETRFIPVLVGLLWVVISWRDKWQRKAVASGKIQIDKFVLPRFVAKFWRGTRFNYVRQSELVFCERSI